MDFYRGAISPRKLAVLIRYLPRDSAVVAALNDGQPPWSSVEHLLADIWSVLVKVHSDPKKAPEVIDHPVRAEAAAKALSAAKTRLKAMFIARKKSYKKGGD